MTDPRRGGQQATRTATRQEALSTDREAQEGENKAHGAVRGTGTDAIVTVPNAAIVNNNANYNKQEMGRQAAN